MISELGFEDRGTVDRGSVDRVDKEDETISARGYDTGMEMVVNKYLVHSRAPKMRLCLEMTLHPFSCSANFEIY